MEKHNGYSVRQNYKLGSYTLKRCRNCLERFMSLGNMYRTCRYCGYKNRGGI